MTHQNKSVLDKAYSFIEEELRKRGAGHLIQNLKSTLNDPDFDKKLKEIEAVLIKKVATAFGQDENSRYDDNWTRLVLMVNKNDGNFHVLEGEREPGDPNTDREYIGVKAMRDGLGKMHQSHEGPSQKQSTEDRLGELLIKIESLSIEDVEAHKLDVWTAYASVVEELGEVARALKVEQGVRGNKHKILEEPFLSEMTDLMMTAVFMYVIMGGKIKGGPPLFKYTLLIPDSPTAAHIFKNLADITQFVAKIPSIIDDDGRYSEREAKMHAFQLLRKVTAMFYQHGGTAEFLVNTWDKKVDKWASKIGITIDEPI